jgi:hypothetical protein
VPAKSDSGLIEAGRGANKLQEQHLDSKQAGMATEGPGGKFWSHMLHKLGGSMHASHNQQRASDASIEVLCMI